MVRCRFVLSLALLMIFSCETLMGQIRPSPRQVRHSQVEAQVLTRGPIHEAFADAVVFDPEPGIIVPFPPPDLIEEYPPDQGPIADNVAWIPGYWAWDDSRDDYIWVSGVWRIAPPGRTWIPGYWAEEYGGYQWVCGFWMDDDVRALEYLPEPPESIESGPGGSPPREDAIWVPGSWVWHSYRYVWRPGYWTIAHPEWVLVPAHYVWAPGGYVFVDRYWDYEIEERGVLFAPVYFGETIYQRRQVVYEPRTVINVQFLFESLFVRPTYNHYYFGDYYAPAWDRRGFFPAYEFHRRHRGYDPFYAHRSWRHRSDRDWDRRHEERFHRRRGDARNRPPHTWQDQVSGLFGDDRGGSALGAVAGMLLDEFTGRNDAQFRFRRIEPDEKRKLGKTQQNIDRARMERKKSELTAAAKRAAQAPRGREASKPETTRLNLPRTTIIGKRSGRKAAPPVLPPPPKFEEKVSPKPRSRAPDSNRLNLATRKGAERAAARERDKKDKRERPKKP